MLCDFNSIACNSQPIESLLNNRIKIKHHHNLHAKTWIAGSEIVVGSANASRAALGLSNVQNNSESCVYINDEHVANNVHSWFNRLWIDAHEITMEDVRNKKVKEKERSGKLSPKSDNIISQRPNNISNGNMAFQIFESFVGEVAANAWIDRIKSITGEQYNEKRGINFHVSKLIVKKDQFLAALTEIEELMEKEMRVRLKNDDIQQEAESIALESNFGSIHKAIFDHVRKLKYLHLYGSKDYSVRIRIDGRGSHGVSIFTVRRAENIQTAMTRKGRVDPKRPIGKS